MDRHKQTATKDRVREREHETERTYTVVASCYKDVNLSFFVTEVPGDLEIFLVRLNRENPITEPCVRKPEV